MGRPVLPLLPPGEEVLARVPEGDDLGECGPEESEGSVTQTHHHSILNLPDSKCTGHTSCGNRRNCHIS